MRLARNSITHIAALKTRQTAIEFNQQVMHYTGKQLIGIASSLIDLQSGMSTAQAFQDYLTGHEIGSGLFLFIFQCSCDINSSCTTDIKFSFVFRIEVQQNLAFQCTRFQAECTIHTRFLILSNQCLQRTMFQVFCFKYSHNGGHTHAVIGTQRSAFGLYPIAVNVCFNGIFGKVVNSIVVLLRHHIHMRLKNNSFTVFHTRSGRLTDNDIAHLIDK